MRGVTRTTGRRGALALLAVAVGALGAAGAAIGATRLPGIRTPSGNISCLAVPGPTPAGGGSAPATLLCRIARASYAARLQAHCGAPPIKLDWHGFELRAASRGSLVCSGGILYNPATQRPSYVTLGYGRSWRHGTFTCRSALRGLTCANRAGHGLFLSRASWRAW
jgi:hypothetical protein